SPPRPPDPPRMSLRINGTGYRTPPALPAPVPVPVPVEPAAMPDTVEPTPAEPSAEWLAAVAELQRQTAEAHMHFQDVLAGAHRDFLRLAETTFAAFAAPGTVPSQDPVSLPPPPPPPAIVRAPFAETSIP